LAKVWIIVLLMEITTPAPLPQTNIKKQNNQKGISKARNIRIVPTNKARTMTNPQFFIF
jgi:hypothetical protein